MAFVKLDTRILNSTLWMDADACRVFITALLMAEPFEVVEPATAINTHNTEPSGFVVPVGWYGKVSAAGPGIVRQAMVDQPQGLDALQRLASPDPNSRTADHEGRRMVRVNGGFLILNYMAHRDVDHTNAERQARFRQRNAVTTRRNAVTVTPVTHADADADADKSKDQKPARAARLPLDWQPDADLIAYARTKRPGLNLADEIENFRDYWIAKAGKDAAKLDWPATFRRWIRNAQPGESHGRSNGSAPRLSLADQGRAAHERAERHRDPIDITPH